MSLKSNAVVRITKPTKNITCILAPNPSAMTYRGTNTYIIDNNELAIIDPGPINDEHFNNILKVIDDRPVKFIFLTHSHVDHSPLAKKLSNKLATQTYAFGPSESGLSKIMLFLIANGYKSVGEGIDYNFMPDYSIKDGEQFILGNDKIRVIYTPGHMGNHVCFQYGEILFSGDHVMDWATSMVSPPYGDIAQFMNSCRKLESNNFKLFLPGHGAPVRNPSDRLRFLINHRLERESQILETLEKISLNAEEITKIIYTDIDKLLIPAATRNVFAHLIDLNSRGILTFKGSILEQTRVEKVKNN